MEQQQTTLGIIAGGGSLPKALIEACRQKKIPVFVLALKGQAEPDILDGTPGTFIRLGAVGKAFKLLKKANALKMVLIGSVRRPSLAEIYPDWKAFCMMCRVGFRVLGDDSLLKIILSEVEHQGFQVVGIDTIMPELLAPQGIYGKVKPSAADMADIKRGIEVTKALGQVDVGQAAIVQRGLVLAVEGIEGTGELIKRTARLKRRGNGGVLVKVAKPQQDRRVDLPTIGPATVQSVFDAGFKGIAVESGSALLAESDAMMKLADKLGIFVMGVSCKP